MLLMKLQSLHQPKQTLPALTIPMLRTSGFEDDVTFSHNGIYKADTAVSNIL